MIYEPNYRDLLENEDLKRWYENLEAGSGVTADVYLRTLGLFCELNNTTSEKIVDMVNNNPKEFKNMFKDFAIDPENQGKAGSYIVRFKKVLRSWPSNII